MSTASSSAPPSSPATPRPAEARARAAVNGPLFYRRPEPLSPHRHAHWRLRRRGVGFAAGVNAVPVLAGELAAAIRHYPLVFAETEAVPVAVLGLEKANLFVEDGDWARETYIPAYVRRYPFLSMAVESSEHVVLAIDAACDYIAEGESNDEDTGTALFEEGSPSPLTREMARFCEAFRRDQAATMAWVAALKEQGVLANRQALMHSSSGRKHGFGGFQAVDPQRLAALDEAVIVDWHRKGYLAWTALHLASLDRFNDLLARLDLRGQPAAGGDDRSDPQIP